MKVYIRFNDKDYEHPGVSDLANSLVFKSLEVAKYRIMWALRSIENEINEEGGMVIVSDDFKIETKNFSTSLKNKITDLIAEEFSRS